MCDFFASFVTYTHEDLYGKFPFVPWFWMAGWKHGFLRTVYREILQLLPSLFIRYAGILHEDAAKAGKIGSFTVKALLSHWGNTSVWSGGELFKEAQPFSRKG
jgi:hypothetical protein